jgi:hypothetical protein
MYSGADKRTGFLNCTPSDQWYSYLPPCASCQAWFPRVHAPTPAPTRQGGGHTYLGPADMTLQSAGVQNSVMVPYSMLIWLKKSTAAQRRRAWVSGRQGGTSRTAPVCERTIHGQPFVEVLALGQRDGQAQITAPERRLSVLFKLVLLGSLWNVLLRLECLAAAPA